jgi:cardiolipin synthase C
MDEVLSRFIPDMIGKMQPMFFLSLILALLVAVTGCTTLPVDYERTQTVALQDTESTRLGRSGRAVMKGHEGLDGSYPLPNGVDALIMRLHLAEAAERSLDIMYYIWQPDLVGRHLAAAVLRAADRGVRVRLLLDDLGTNADDNALMSLDAHPDIEIRLFNPVASRTLRNLSSIGDFSRVNRRMHNKAFVADNQRAVLGGRNIGDQYFGAHADVDYGDLDVALIGPIVHRVSSAFDLYWNASMVYPVAALTGRSGDRAGLGELRAQLSTFVNSQRDSPFVLSVRSEAALVDVTNTGKLFWGKAHLLVDDPAKVTRDASIAEGRLLPQFAALGVTPTKEITIVSPYFVPGEAGVAWLTGLVRNGVRVTVLTNSLASNDVTPVHAGYKRYRGALVDGGVRLYELRPEAIGYQPTRGKEKRDRGSRAALHAKTFVFDRRAIFIGSLNLDPRSIVLNTEIGVVCESAAMAESVLGPLEDRLDQIAWRLEREADETGRKQLVWIETGEKGVRRLTEEPGVSTWRRMGVWFLGILPIESML